MWVPPPRNVEALARAERDERDARLALEAAQTRAYKDREYAPEEHHELIRKLGEEWNHALRRLHRTRKGLED